MFQPPLNAGEAKYAFRGLDADHDLILVADEFLAGTRTFKPPLTRKQAEYAFAGLDADHDNLLVFNEALKVFRFGHFYPTLEELARWTSERGKKANDFLPMDMGEFPR